MDKQQKLSMIKHISQKIFINKASSFESSKLRPEVCVKYYENFAADSLTAATIFVQTFETVLKDSGVENEADLSS